MLELITQLIVVALGLFCSTSAVLVRFLRGTWWVRSVENGRLQVAVISLLLFVISLWLLDRRETWVQVHLAVFGAALLYQMWLLLHYTPLWRKDLETAPPANPARTFTILSANVEMGNRDAAPFFDLVERASPDLVLTMEVNAWWHEQLQRLKRDYPHVVEQPQEDYFGISLYSRLTLEKSEVRHVAKENVPSIHALVTLPAGEVVEFWGLHPNPPLPDRSVRDQNRELLRMARLIRHAQHPTVVAGDFNDVPWSHTVRRFRTTARLRDPRRGRRFVNSFSVGNPLLRMPLDHIFVGARLSLHEFTRFTHSADHFALFARVSLDE